MTSVIPKMIRQYGSSVTLVKDGAETAIRAFLQETKSKGEGGAEREFSALGEVPRGVYVYMGPVSPEAAAGDVLVYQGKTLEVRRTELVTVGDRPLYCWGVCVEKGGDSTWGS